MARARLAKEPIDLDGLVAQARKDEASADVLVDYMLDQGKVPPQSAGWDRETLRAYVLAQFPYWYNPYTDVVRVPLEELAAAHMHLGQLWGTPEGPVIATPEWFLSHWRQRGDKLDAYILLQPSGFHDIGVRYGPEDSDYLSPAGDQEKVDAILKKYEWPAPSRVSRGRRWGARESDHDGSLICMGRHVIAELENGREIEMPARWGMLYDASGKHWPSCSLLFAPFEQGSEVDESLEGRDYFGRNAEVFRGEINLPPRDLDAWREAGIVKQVFYERAGSKAPGRYRHKFNKPRGLMKLVALFKKRVAETPVVLYKCGRDAFRLELPQGCMIDDRGIVLP